MVRSVSEFRNSCQLLQSCDGCTHVEVVMMMELYLEHRGEQGHESSEELVVFEIRDLQKSYRMLLGQREEGWTT